LLELACGGSETAKKVMAAALADAKRTELPEASGDIVAFVRAHLSPILAREIGPRLTMALVDDLLVQLEAPPSPSSPPPSSMPRPVARVALRPSVSMRARGGKAKQAVLLVDPDRVGRTTLARALLRARWDVTVIDSKAELDEVLAGAEPIDAVIVDAQHASARAVIETLGVARPQIAVVARSNDAAKTGGILGDAGFTRFVVCPRDAQSDVIIEAVRRALEG
jgi:hypothetical protein